MTATRLKQRSTSNSQLTLAVFAFLLLALFSLTACSGTADTSATPTPKDNGAPFRPLAPQKTTPSAAALTPTSAATKPAPTPACLDNLNWISDVTIPDGSQVGPKSTLDKRWEVKNSGNCNWDEHYRLRLTAGPGMNAAQEQAMFPARSGTKVVLRIVFQAPADPGKYRSAWQAYNPEGHPFGDPIFIDIEVK
jgi:hypothetical protein